MSNPAKPPASPAWIPAGPGRVRLDLPAPTWPAGSIESPRPPAVPTLSPYDSFPEPAGDDDTDTPRRTTRLA